MTVRVLVADGYFDGEACHTAGPYTFLIDGATILDIVEGEPGAHRLPENFRAPGTETHLAAFVLPGLVEAHCHLFLDGGELDFKARSAYLKEPLDEMAAHARRNVQANLAAGVTLIRDAGDKHGINHRMRAESQGVPGPRVRSPGLGVRKPKRYGGFMAREVETEADIRAAVAELLETGDALKIILTGIIDFEAGRVLGEPQFDLGEAQLMVQLAHARGKLTYAHCSGIKGLDVAAGAGISSIEHGFFMERRILEVMTEKGLAWVPTFSPVHFQWARPELAGWDAPTVANLRSILDSHLEHIRLAAEMGVALVAGSDAGSHGVRHGEALIDELFFFLEAGLSMDATLRSATSVPRRLWGAEPNDLIPGAPAEFVTLAGSPLEDAENLRRVRSVFRDGQFLEGRDLAA